MKSVLGVHWKDWCWSWNCNMLATTCKVLIHYKRPWSLEGLGAGGEGDDRGWDGWMALTTRWIWVWGDCVSWWWTGRPGVLWFMGSQESHRTERLNWTELNRSLCWNFPCFHSRCLRFPRHINYIDHIWIGLPHWATQCAVPFTGRSHSCDLQFEGPFSVKSNVQPAGHGW